MECSCYIFPEEILGNFWDNTLLRSLFLQLVWALRYSIPKPQNSYISNLPSLVEPLPSRVLRKEAELPGRVHCTESSGSVFHAPPSPPPPPLPRYFSAFTCLEIIKTVCFFVCAVMYIPAPAVPCDDLFFRNSGYWHGTVGRERRARVPRRSGGERGDRSQRWGPFLPLSLPLLLLLPGPRAPAAQKFSSQPSSEPGSVCPTLSAPVGFPGIPGQPGPPGERP